VNPSKIALLSAAALTFLFAPAPVRGAASAWSVNPQSRVRLISPWQVAPRGGDLVLGLQFRLAPGWHVYWKNSGDAGFPPVVTFQPAEILGKPELLWPTPSRFELPGGLVAFGYEGEVVYPVHATIWPDSLPASQASPSPAEATPGASSFFIKADLDYLTCKIDCVPYRYRLTLEQPLGDQPIADPETSPLLQAWLDRLPHALAEVPGLKYSTVLDASRPGGAELEIRLLGITAQSGKTDLFLESNELFDAGRPRVKGFADGVIFHVPMKPRDLGKPLPAKLVIAWTATNLSSNGESLALEARREVDVLTAPSPRPGDGKKIPASQRVGRILLWAFLGGVLLNLAPTVLALLACEVLALRQAGRSRVREGAAAAATGIVGACWGVAALAVAMHWPGLPAGWGSQLQEPALRALLAVAAALLALNLWGLVELPLAPAGSSRTGTGRHLLAGLFTVPLALAWPVPMLQEPLVFASARGAAMVSAVFAVVGFGLALPYLVLAFVPALIRPASGVPVWVPRLREGLGFLAGASTLWTLHDLAREVSPEGLAWIELSLLGMALLAWLRAREGSGRALRFALALGLAACAAGALWLADHNRLAPRAAATRELFPSQKPSNGLPPAVREPISNQTSGG